jgi:hypothetical protein
MGGVAAVFDERQKAPNASPSPEETILIIGGEVGRYPGNTDAGGHFR